MSITLKIKRTEAIRALGEAIRRKTVEHEDRHSPKELS
jgi:hypothetical protein